VNGNPLWRVVACLLTVIVSCSMAGATTLEDPASSAESGIPGVLCAATAEVAGPADGCCARHLEVCEGLCSAGSYEFACFTTDTGGCKSVCKCGTGGAPQV
jgi:hypothetical protein